MSSPLRSLIACGTKIWLDSIDPDLVVKNRAQGASGATSNPIIVSDLIKTGRFDDDLDQLIEQKLSDEQIAWKMTDKLVSDAQAVFRPVFEQTHGNDGFVSFELDPLLEDLQLGPPHAERVALYRTGHQSRPCSAAPPGPALHGRSPRGTARRKSTRAAR